ncbi:hypothetical protein T484DRAFT_1764479 [Baffinella frigidus]|nr:hypothetical protein T484DRAFT_1764479 [Cryptophyta sp. CCMP2293]
MATTSLHSTLTLAVTLLLLLPLLTLGVHGRSVGVARLRCPSSHQSERLDGRQSNAFLFPPLLAGNAFLETMQKRATVRQGHFRQNVADLLWALAQMDVQPGGKSTSVGP